MQPVTPQKGPRPPLIIDPDPSFCDSLKKDPKAELVPPLLAKGVKQGQLILTDPNRAISGVFISTEFGRGEVLTLIRASHYYRPSTPLFLIHMEGDPPFSDEELRELGVLRAMAKPLSLTQILESLTPKGLLFDAQSMIEEGKANKDQVGQEGAFDDAAFVPIRADNFLSGSTSYFNLYVRLAAGRYIKILHAGDAFLEERLQQYLNKGVTHFYLKKETQERYLSYCDRLAGAILKSDKAPMALKASQTLNQGTETLKFLGEAGLSDVNLQYANQFSQNVHSLVKQLDPKANAVLGDFLSNLALYEHGVSVSMLAAILSNVLDLGGSRSVQILGMSSLLHDIGLSKIDQVVQDEDESKMSEEQRTIYHAHPMAGAQLVREIRGADPTVAQAVAQHHERRNKRGFPNRIGSGLINRVAEVVGVSDEFARLIQKATQDRELNPLHEMEKTVLQGFSPPILEAFRKAFTQSTPKKK